MSNMAIWDKVCKTDPNYTKGFQRSGGFKGTAINSIYNVMKATELFGPVGLGWGFTIESTENIHLGEEIVNVVKIEFWYRVSPKIALMLAGNDPEEQAYYRTLIGQICTVESFGQTKFVEKRSGGALFVDEEAPKKSVTDALNKILSYAGFSADIFLGLYDDNKYMTEAKKEFGSEKTATIKEHKVEAPAVWSAEVETKAREAVAKMANDELVREVFIDLRTKYNLRDPANAKALDSLIKICNDRVVELKGLAELKAAAGVETKEAA